MRIVDPSVELWQTPTNRDERLKLIERAGRVCYKSEDRIAEDSCTKFISRIIQRNHRSVTEHGNMILHPTTVCLLWIKRMAERARSEGVTLYLRFAGSLVSGNARAWYDFFQYVIGSKWSKELPEELVDFILDNSALFQDLVLTGVHQEYLTDYRPDKSINPEVFDISNEPPEVRQVHQQYTLHFTTDRGTTHELVRHRTISFSQESTRYCNYAHGRFGHEITVIRPQYAERDTTLYPAWLVGCIGAEEAYFAMLDAGATAQEARSVLPNSLKAEVVVSGTIKAWQDFLKLRTAVDAHPDMRRIAERARTVLQLEDPKMF